MSKAQRFHEVLQAYNRHDADAFAAFYAPDAVVEDPQYPEPLRGRDAIRRDMDDFFRAFPDLRGEMKNLLESENTVSFEASFQGTHSGPLAAPSGEIAATGKRFQLNGAVFAEFDDQGQIVYERRYYDTAGMLGQLGAAESDI